MDRGFIIAVIIDCIYQVLVFRWFYPSQDLFVVVILALLPYVVFLGVLNRIA